MTDDLEEEFDDYRDEYDDDEPDQDPDPEVETEHRPANLTQELLLSYLLDNDDAWVTAAPIVKSDYFDAQYRPVIKMMMEHVARYKMMPQRAIIQARTAMLLPPTENASDERTTQWLLDEMEKFCRVQALRIELMRAMETLGKDSSDETISSIGAQVKKAAEIGLSRDLGIEIHKDLRIITSKDGEKIDTGYRHLDMATFGGLPRPGIALFAAKTGVGKSVILPNLAIKQIERGRMVVYISLELNEKRLARRFAGMMTGIAVDHVKMRIDEAEEIMSRRVRAGEGEIWIKRFPMNGTTVNHIRAYIKAVWMKTGRKPDVCCLDYINLMSPATKGIPGDSIHLKDKAVSTELFDLMNELNMLCCTASQMVKKAEDFQSDQSQIAGGTPLTDTADYVGVLRRELESGILFMQLTKGRDGGGGMIVPLLWDDDTLKIDDMRDDDLFLEKNPYFRMPGMPPRKQDPLTRAGRKVNTRLAEAKAGMYSNMSIIGSANQEENPFDPVTPN